MNDQSNDNSQDFYSSTSSDDQSSIASVIHVVGSNDEGETVQGSSAGTDSGRQITNDTEDLTRITEKSEVDRAKQKETNRSQHTDDSSSESEEDNVTLRRQNGNESDSSTTTEEGTEIWMPSPAQGKGFTKPDIPPKPSHQRTPSQPEARPLPYQRPVSQPEGRAMPCQRPPSQAEARTSPHQTVVRQGSSGRVETQLLHPEDYGTDSGLGKESPEVPSYAGGVSVIEKVTSHHHPHITHHAPQTRPFSQTSPHPQSSPIATRTHGGRRSPTQSRRQSGLAGGPSPLHKPQAVHYQVGSPTGSGRISVLPSLASPGPSTAPQAPASPTSLRVERVESPTPATIDMSHMGQHLRESLYSIISGLYALVLVVLGTALPLAEVFAPQVPPGMFEGYYIYLFAVSTVFLLYAYMCLLRSNHHTPQRPRPKPPDTQDPLLTKSPSRLRLAVESHGHTGSFYLRLGAVGFGIGAMILEGLVFGRLFEMELSAHCVDVIQAVTPMIHLLFIFTQMYFIFLNGRMGMRGYKLLACFGLMHMCATNVCILIRAVVKETIRDVNQRSRDNNPHHPSHSSNASDNSSAPPSVSSLVANQGHASILANMESSVQANNEVTTLPSNTSADDFSLHGNPNHGVATCVKQDILTTVVERASPYLYPCTVAYCLIAAGILFMMWRRVGWRPTQRTPSPIAATPSPRSPRGGVDCTASNRGLFLGIFTLVGVIISMIIFFVLVDKPQFIDIAVLVVNGTEAVLYVLTLFAIAIAAFRIRNMCFIRKLDKTKKLEQGLLLISFGGLLLLCVFNIVAGSLRLDTVQGSLFMATNCLVIVQSFVQTVFILCSLHRSARTVFHSQKKPGREYITFVLVCNIAMWGVYTFEVLRMESSPVAMEVYGHVPWSIVTRITIPLAIFYRFHSTVCLAAIWSNIYKKNI